MTEIYIQILYYRKNTKYNFKLKHFYILFKFLKIKQ